MADLVKIIKRELLPTICESGMVIDGEYGGPREVIQTVDLRVQDLSMRISREKQFFEVLFRSTIDPTQWFDSSAVFTYLGEDSRTLTTRSVDHMIRSLREFLRTQFDDVIPLFARDRYPSVRQELLRLHTAANREFLLGLKRKAAQVRTERKP